MVNDMTKADKIMQSIPPNLKKVQIPNPKSRSEPLEVSSRRLNSSALEGPTDAVK